MKPRVVRVGALAAVSSALATLIASNFYRVYREVSTTNSDDKQWESVLRHERRFLQAIKASTSAEGIDDD